MSKHSPHTLLGGELEGSLPDAKVRGESANIVLAMRVFARGSAAAAAAASSAPAGASVYPKGAAWSGGGVAVVAGGADVVYAEAQAAGTITSATVLGAGGPGSCAIDVWKTTYAGALPTVADKISGASGATISGASKSQDTTLVGWTSVAVLAGDILAFKLSSCTTFTWVAIILEITP